MAETEGTYTEKVIATRVNRSGDYPEISLRGTKSNHSFVLRTASGTGHIKADEIYDLTITKAAADETKADAIDFSKMTKAELIGHADENKIEGIAETMTKAEIIQAIEANKK